MNKLYDLYLMLIEGYVILLIFTIEFIVTMFRLNKKINYALLRDVNDEIYYNKDINN